MKIITPGYCKVTIRRPNGQTETITHPTIQDMGPADWRRFCDAMTTAKRGTPLSYDNHAAVAEMDAADRELDDYYKSHDLIERIR